MNQQQVGRIRTGGASPLLAAACLGLAFLSGCGGPSDTAAVSAGTTASLEGNDLVVITDDIAQQLAASPRIADEIAKRGQLIIVLMPAENFMTGEVLPSGVARAFVFRVRNLLQGKDNRGHYLWVANRDYFNALRDRETDKYGPNPANVQPTHALYANFTSLANVTSEKREQYYFLRFTLTDINDRREIWSGAYELKKRSVRGSLD